MKRLAGLLFIILAIKVSVSEAGISSPRDCFIPDYAYGGDNILVSGKYNVKDSAALCQQSCQAITNCQFFSFYESTGYCELKFGGNGLPLPGVISGPRHC